MSCCILLLKVTEIVQIGGFFPLGFFFEPFLQHYAGIGCFILYKTKCLGRDIMFHLSKLVFVLLSQMKSVQTARFEDENHEGLFSLWRNAILHWVWKRILMPLLFIYTFVHDFNVSQINKLKEKTNARKEL